MLECKCTSDKMRGLVPIYSFWLKQMFIWHWSCSSWWEAVICTSPHIYVTKSHVLDLTPWHHYIPLLAFCSIIPDLPPHLLDFLCRISYDAWWSLDVPDPLDGLASHLLWTGIHSPRSSLAFVESWRHAILELVDGSQKYVLIRSY